jgi:uncharacterized Ntn-hydrolase superfamily protein
MTYSIVARDPQTGDLGVAVQSRFPAVGAVVPWARAGVGAVATQAYGHPGYGPAGLDLLAAGLDPAAAIDDLTREDIHREERQLGIVAADGRSASFTGRACFSWAGGRLGDDFAAQGNILAGPSVVDALAETYLAGDQPLPERLITCLIAAQASGGDRRGQQSAALLVVRAGGGYGGLSDRWIDLRVDDHARPIEELSRLLEIHRLYLDAPSAEDLVALDEATVVTIQRALTSLGVQPGGPKTLIYVPMDPSVIVASHDQFAVGRPRACPHGWDDSWHQSLNHWIATENLEMRTAAMGWIDPRVLCILRGRALEE